MTDANHMTNTSNITKSDLDAHIAKITAGGVEVVKKFNELVALVYLWYQLYNATEESSNEIRVDNLKSNVSNIGAIRY